MTRATAVPRTSSRALHDGWVVASSCPRCGAPLDFAEGTNAVRCGHCASVLLVTGRRRVLSYVVRPRVAAHEAAKIAAFAIAPSQASPAASRASAQRERRATTPQLVFVPYYRLCAEEVSWHRERAPRRDAGRDASPGDAVADPLMHMAVAGGRARDAEHVLTLASRAIERSFLACDAAGLASWSLGVRTGVLRLELFERGALEGQGRVLRPTIAPETALARALAPPGGVELVHRDVLRAVLSLVYFPLWVVTSGDGESARALVVDGVTGAVVARDAGAEILARDDGAAPPSARVLGFRPLCCPNCGWELPVRPADVVFHCTSCERTWELVGEELERVESDVLAHRDASPARRTPLHDARAHNRVPHLPVWQVAGRVRVAGIAARSALPERLFAPAFRWRALKSLCDLGARLAQRTAQDVAPAGGHEPVKNMPLLGCSLDRGDALTLARLVALRLLLDDANVRDDVSRGRPMPEVAIDDASTRLVWLPFAGDAYSLRDPLTGYALPRRSVDAMLA